MNKKLSRILLTSASTIALLGAYPSIASSVDGLDAPVVTVQGASADAVVQEANASDFVDIAYALPNVAEINQMDAAELAGAAEAASDARATYDLLSDEDKAASAVVTWEGYLAIKEDALGSRFVAVANALPRVALYADMDAAELAETGSETEAVRNAYNALPARVQADSDVALWEGYLTDKENALGLPFISEANALPYVSSIVEMDAVELAEAAAEMSAARDTYDGLPTSAKSLPGVVRWAGYLAEKEESLASQFLDLAHALPSVAGINEMNEEELAEAGNEISAVRDAYDALPAHIKENATVNRWDGFITQKADAVAEAIDAPVEEGLVVVEVSAINDMTIASGEETNLKFEVNGKEKLTKAEFDEKYGEEGYTVDFKYNRTPKDETLKNTGEVKTAKSFKYAVQVKDAEGNLIPEELELKDYLEVKVVDAEKATTIETVKIKGSDLDYVTVGAEELEFEVTSAKNALGEELDEDSLAALNSKLQGIVSDDVDVAYPTSSTQFTARAAGNVTFTLTYYTEDDAIEVEVPVEVKEAGVATRVEAEDQKVAIGASADKDGLDFKVFDQHDLDITNSTDEYKVVVKDDENKVVTDLSAKGTYTVEIQDKKDKVLGSFKVTVVDVGEADYDEFFFEADKDAEGKDIVLDVKEGEREATKPFTLKGVKDGVTVVAHDLDIVTEGDGLYLKSSDKDVFTVNYNAGTVTVTLATDLDKAATAKVQLINKMGSIEIVEAEVELEVKNTTPQIDKLELVDGAKIAVADYDKSEIEGNFKDNFGHLLTAGLDKDKNEIFVYGNMVEKVTFIPGNNIVEVKINDIYGGKTFRFDVEKDTTDPEIVSAVAERDNDGNIVLTVQAKDENLYALEVDHSHGNYGKYKDVDGNSFLPEFHIYASEENPYGNSEAAFVAAGVNVTYNAANQTWVLTMEYDGNAMAVINNSEISNGEFEFYLVAQDIAGNESGDMYSGEEGYTKVTVAALEDAGENEDGQE